MITPLLIVPLLMLGFKAVGSFADLIEGNNLHERKGAASGFVANGVAAAGLIVAIVRLN